MSFPRMHVSLYVSDIDKTVQFYRAFFNQQEEKVKPGYAKFVLDEPSLIISFVENKERVAENFGHLGFQVETEEELEKRLAAAQAQNLVSKEEIGTNCCYAKQDKFWVTDPDGVQWEVYYFHEDVEFNDPRYADTSEAVCCAPSAVTAPTQKKKVSLGSLGKEEACCEPGSGCC